MNKIPVWKTVGYAYSFTFGHLGTIIGLIWIPMLAFTVGNFFVMKPYYEAMASADGTLITGSPLILYVFAFEAVALLVLAMIGVAITQEALGLRKPGPVLAHFALGATEFRVLGGFLILVGLWLGFLLAYVLGATVIGTIIGLVLRGVGGDASIAAALGAAAAVAGLLAVIYAMVRLSFLVVPATVAEGRVGIIRSWVLTGGNFWRIFLIALCTLLPIMCLLIAIQVVIVGPDALVPPLDALKNPAKQALFAAKQSRAMLEHLPLVMALSFLASPILNGLVFAPSAVAYRALVPPGSEPVAPTA